MGRNSRWLVILPALWFALTPQQAKADPEPGLTAVGYYINNIPPTRSDDAYPTCGSEVENNINRNFNGEPFQDCGWDYFMVHYTGFITIPENSTVKFMVAADDGGTINIDGYEFGTWNLKGCSWSQQVTLPLSGGTYPLDGWFFEAGGGTCYMLAWNIDNTGWEIVPEWAFTTTSIPATTTTTSTVPSTTVPVTTTTSTTLQETSTTTTIPVEEPSTTTTPETTTSSTSTTTTTTTSTPPTTTSTTATTTTTTVVQTTTTEAPYIPPATVDTTPPSTLATTTTAVQEPSTTTEPATTVPPVSTTEAPPPPTSQPKAPTTVPSPQTTASTMPPVAPQSTLVSATPETSLPPIQNVLEAPSVSQEQVTALATNPQVLATVSSDQAEQIFQALDVAELSEEQTAELIAAVQDAPTQVRAAFEKEINIFAEGLDDYVPLGSNIPVGTRRTLIAVTAGLTLAAAGTRMRR